MSLAQSSVKHVVCGGFYPVDSHQRGFTMAKKKVHAYSEPPVPKSLGFWETKAIERMGRRDAKSTQGLRDTTRTQAVVSFENKSQRGEIQLNDWVEVTTKSYISGNARIEEEAPLVCARIGRAKNAPRTTGRQAIRAAAKQNELEQDLTDMRSQYAANREFGAGQIRRAESVKPLWETIYKDRVAIYNRARANKLKQDIDAAAAEIPVYRSVPLVELPQLDREFPIAEGSC
jgi:hypothetical protein